MAVDTAIHHPFIKEIERVWSAVASPAALQRAPVSFDPTIKAFNMSESYATSFGSGAREQIQNWWDECRVRAGKAQCIIRCMDHATSSEIAHRHHLKADAKTYAAFDQTRLLGMLLDCTDQAGQQLLVLKNCGGQMTLDNLILGESTRRSNMALAGQK